MQYHSSRGQSIPLDAARAIVKGISPDGGLFVPQSIPRMNEGDINGMRNLSYQDRAAYILKLYLPDFTSEEINDCVSRAYNSDNFDHEQVAPLIRLRDGLYIMELWHGPTSAFKDMALQLLPRLLIKSVRKTEDEAEIIILVATSGDTGKAALEGFKDVPGTRIIVFFPQYGVSEVQKRQMLIQEGGNVYVAAVEGNFDDAQNGVKRIFASENLKLALTQRGMKLSSANSINWGRLLPQIVYYVSAYVDLCRAGRIAAGEAINYVVPTGNFGNILAAFYAGRMGVPINKLVCASNANNVLSDFIKNGVYDRRRKFEKTISPSMDILISSNLERLLYELTGHDADQVGIWMDELKINGSYEVDQRVKAAVQELFWADFSSDEETIDAIRSTWERDGYLLDTHTAVAMDVYEKYRRVTGDESVSVIVSTASPFKFGNSVAQAILKPEQLAGQSEFELLRLLAQESGLEIPEGIRHLEDKVIRHSTVTSNADMEKAVMSFLGLAED